MEAAPAKSIDEALLTLWDGVAFCIGPYSWRCFFWFARRRASAEYSPVPCQLGLRDAAQCLPNLRPCDPSGCALLPIVWGD